MEKTRKTKLSALYFGVKLPSLNYDSRSKREFVTYNLFGFAKVQWAVASYVAKTPEEKKKIENPLFYCFSSVWSRCEYEFVVCPWGSLDNDDKAVEVGTKVDIYGMYVEPNAEHLMELVDNVSVSSAKKYLTEGRKRYKR